MLKTKKTLNFWGDVMGQKKKENIRVQVKNVIMEMHFLNDILLFSLPLFLTFIHFVFCLFTLLPCPYRLTLS